MRHTFSGPAVADCLPISYILRIESGSKSHGAVPLDFANMMSQPAGGPSVNQRRPRSSIICQTEITSTTLFCRFRKRGSWPRKDDEISVQYRESDLYVHSSEWNIPSTWGSFFRICVTREIGFMKITSILNHRGHFHLATFVTGKFLQIGATVRKIDESREIRSTKLRVSEYRESRN